MYTSETQRNPDSKIIPLNLILDYPVNWSRYKVLRDLVQNFYDAVGCQEWHKRFSYSLESNLLCLKVKDVGFSYDWLIPIGASTKRKEAGKYAGFFGEGFKIASLCAIRDYDWNIKMASRNWELQVIVKDIVIDGIKTASLAYSLSECSQAHKDTVLTLSPFSERHILESVLLSFFYPKNPLFGKKNLE